MEGKCWVRVCKGMLGRSGEMVGGSVEGECWVGVGVWKENGEWRDTIRHDGGH